MIPFFQIEGWVLGPIVIQSWGLMVALGIVAAVILADQYAKKLFLSRQVIWDIAWWSLVGGLIGARLFYILFYNLEYYIHNWPATLYFWQGGASSFGGFVGAWAALTIFAKARHFTFRELKPYIDIFSLGLWLGWAIGRSGCFLIHDHPGQLSNFFLAVQFSSGARHDLGLYEALLALFIFLVFWRLFKRLAKTGWGKVALYSWAAYSVGRFGLDFLRATDLPGSDQRFAFLTLTQWLIILFWLALTAFLIWGKMKRRKLTD